jgi:hypothetical protein
MFYYSLLVRYIDGDKENTDVLEFESNTDIREAPVYKSIALLKQAVKQSTIPLKSVVGAACLVPYDSAEERYHSKVMLRHMFKNALNVCAQEAN